MYVTMIMHLTFASCTLVQGVAMALQATAAASFVSGSGALFLSLGGMLL